MTDSSLVRAAGLACGLVLAMSTAGAVEPAGSPASTPAPAVQAEAPKPQLTSVTIVQVKPDMLLEWQEMQKSEIIPALKKAGLKQRAAWTTGIFGQAYEYVFVTPIQSFAQYDGPGPLVRALGEEGARALNAKSRRMVTGSRTYAMRTRPDLSHETKMTGPPKLAIITNVQLAQGRGADFESFLKSEWLPAVKKAQLPGYWVMQTVFGGDTNTYVTVVPLQAFADLDKGHPVEQALGEEGMARLAKVTSAFTARIERRLSRFVPDLSFQPESPSSEP